MDPLTAIVALITAVLLGFVVTKRRPGRNRIDPSNQPTPNEFSLLSLPNELICKVLSLLPIQDRLRARVNRKLNEIEAEEKYEYHKIVFITQDQSTQYKSDCNSNRVTVTLNKAWEFYIDGLNKIIENCTFECISIDLYEDWNAMTDKDYDYLFQFVCKMKSVAVHAWDRVLLRRQNHLEEILEGRVAVNFELTPPWLSFEFLLEICEIIESGFDSLAAVMLGDICSSLAIRLLEKYGFIIRDDSEDGFCFGFTEPNREFYRTMKGRIGEDEEWIVVVGRLMICVTDGILWDDNLEGGLKIIRLDDEGKVPKEVERILPCIGIGEITNLTDDIYPLYEYEDEE